MSAMQVEGTRRGSGRKRPRGLWGGGPKRKRAKRPRYKQTMSPGDELKFHDVDIDDAVVATAGFIFPSVLTIAQGDGESERLGRKCVVKKIGWRFQLDLPLAANLTNSATVRVLLYLDKQCNGAAATVSQAIDADGILETSDFQSFNNLSNSGRYTVWMDRTYTINKMAGAGDGTANDAAPVLVNDTFFKTCSVPLEYSSNVTTDGAIDTMRSNNIGVLIISDGNIAGFTSKMRVRFVG